MKSISILGDVEYFILSHITRQCCVGISVLRLHTELRWYKYPVCSSLTPCDLKESVWWCFGITLHVLFTINHLSNILSATDNLHLNQVTSLWSLLFM